MVTYERLSDPIFSDTLDISKAIALSSVPERGSDVV